MKNNLKMANEILSSVNKIHIDKIDIQNNNVIIVTYSHNYYTSKPMCTLAYYGITVEVCGRELRVIL